MIALTIQPQKPFALQERLVQAFINHGDVVPDPFFGCGTTTDAEQTESGV